MHHFRNEVVFVHEQGDVSPQRIKSEKIISSHLLSRTGRGHREYSNTLKREQYTDEHMKTKYFLAPMHYGTYTLTYASKPWVHLPRYVTQDRRESTTVGLRDVALCHHWRVCFIWTEEGLQRGIDVVSHTRYAAYEAGSIMPLNIVVDVTNLWKNRQNIMTSV